MHPMEISYSFFASGCLAQCGHAGVGTVQGGRAGWDQDRQVAGLAMADRHDHQGVRRGVPGITGYVPVPTEWPEQEVSIIEEEVSPEAKVTYETVDGGVKIMNVQDWAACRRQGGKGAGHGRDSPQHNSAARQHRRLRDSRRRKSCPRDSPLSCCPARRSRAATRKSAIWPRRSAPTRKRPGIGSKRSTIGSAERKVPERPA